MCLSLLFLLTYTHNLHSFVHPQPRSQTANHTKITLSAKQASIHYNRNKVLDTSQRVDWSMRGYITGTPR